MASLGVSIDPNTVAPSTGGGGKLQPKGDYEFEINESTVEPTRSGKGKVLKMVLVNTGRDDPNLKGLKVYANINLEHENAQAQTIGQGEFSALCHAIGEMGQVDDSEQLHYRPFYARIDHEQAKNWKDGGKPMFKDNGEPMMNAVVKRYLFEDGEAAPGASEPPAKPQTQQQAAPQAQQQAQAQAPAQRTWQRKAS